MSIQEKFYSLDFTSIEISDFFKNLHIVSNEGVMVFVNPSKYIQKQPNNFHIVSNLGNNQLKEYDVNSDDTIFRVEYVKELRDIFLNTKDDDLNKDIGFEHFLYFGKNKQCLVQWIGAGKYTSVYIALEFIQEKIVRKFCKSLYLNDYHVQFFSYGDYNKSC